ncbi:type IV pilus assembly protein PilB [Sinobacterium caligoides]|uniref:Type IV pilus assembly protein PilB n=1 Tax=Sinobacterium caligoides TaxID=933926 RepID=A0A3N2D4N8_9GAMM|nr:type IV-A pilus assembly ATPase PilB [Sinobacterium caligoides]ROR94766.1 type IV pilus assembly protein PilB [Sinobacterium caligoides]
MSQPSISPLNGLARRLVKEGLLDEERARHAWQQAHSDRQPFVSYLVQQQLVPARTIAELASDEFGNPLFDLASLNPEAMPNDLIDPKLIERHRAVPLFKRGTRLFIGVSDPTNFRAQDEIQFHTGLSTEAVLVDEDQLTLLITNLADNTEDTDVDFGDLDDSLEDLDIGPDTQEKEQDDGNGSDDTPIVKFVNKMLLDAIKMGASDLHFEPYEKSYRVRFRTDGVLKEIARPPLTLAGKLSARLKVMSEMDISERRMPQDGRIKLKLSRKRSIDFRVNTLPTLWGEKIVLRILDPSSAQMGIEALGYDDDQKEMYLAALHQPQGMILVTGPTGSGKTVSLYTGLNILNTAERNISTAEDPVEINLEGINQVHVKAKIGLNFSEALRSFLRQDPDVIMVGEIRDLETAEIAIKAAQTGHMVMSTLHTNSAAETVTRLLNMGVPAFNLATTVSLIIAQRLARRLCKHCAEDFSDAPREMLLKEGFTEQDLDTMTLKKPSSNGCSQCNNGYKGRVGIYEVVRITDNLARIIMEEGNSIDIADQARREGFNDLRRSALLKAAAGLTSLEEVNRVTKD